MKIKNKSLLLNFSGYTIINLLNALTPFIILPLLTKNLSSKDIGVIDLFSTSTLFLTPIIGLCIIQSISKLYFTVSDKAAYLSVVATAVLALGSGALVITLAVLFLTDLVPVSYEMKTIIVLVVAYVFMYLLIEGYLTLKRNEENIKQFAYLRLGKATADIILTIVFLQYIEDYQARIFSIVLASFFTTIIILFLANKNQNITISWDKKILKKILLYSSPLILHTFFNNILNYADRYLISDFLGISSLGKYSVVYQLCMIMSLLINSFAMAWTPYFMKNMANNPSQFKGVFNRVFKLYGIALVVGGIILFFIMPLIYKFYVGENYLVEKSIYMAILCGYFFQGLYRFKINHLFFLEKTFSIAQLSFLSALVNITLNYFLIPKWGLFGAAFATLISYLILYLTTEVKLVMVAKKKSLY